VQVLRLMEAFRIEEVTLAVRDAIARGALLRDNLHEKGGGVQILKRRPVAGL